MIHGTRIDLTRREQALLSWLLAHAGDPQSRETLLREVWGYSPGTQSRTVESTMSRLRAKLEAVPRAGVQIRTVRGDGWVLDAVLAPEGAFVGRSEEQRTIERWLAGTGSLLTVTGPPGIGKSALVDRSVGAEVTRIHAADIRSPAEWFSAVEQNGTGPLWLDDADGLVDMLRSILPATLGRRLLVTSCASVRHPAEEVVLLGALSTEDAASLARRLLARWVPSAHWSAEEIARVVRESEGNPLAIALSIRATEAIGDSGADARRVVGRSLDLLSPPGHAGLQRLAAVPCVVPHALAVSLVGTEGTLADLRARSLVVHERPGAWRVPAIVKLGLGEPPEIWPMVAAWVVAHVSSVHGRGVDAWRAFLRAMEAERPALEWVARRCPDEEATWWAALTVDDNAQLVGPDDLMPVLDRAIEVAGSEALVRRAREHVRRNDRLAAEADIDAALAQGPLALGTAPPSQILIFKANLAFYRGDIDASEQLVRAVAATAEAAGDARHEACAQLALAMTAQWRGDHAGALAAARTARSVPPGAGYGHAVVAFLARHLLDAGHDDEARDVVEESGRMAVASGRGDELWLTDAVRAWIDLVTGTHDDAVERLGVSARGYLGRFTLDARLEYACARVVAGPIERGLSELRSSGSEMIASGNPVVAAQARPFAVAGRVRLGLAPHAQWLAPAALDGDPAVHELVRGFEALSRGDETTARGVLERSCSPIARARLLRRMLAEGLG